MKNVIFNWKLFVTLVMSLFFLSLVITACSSPADAQVVRLASGVSADVMCPCGDCTEVLIDCKCDTAQEVRTLIERRIIKGESKEQVIQYLVQQYGQRILP